MKNAAKVRLFIFIWIICLVLIWISGFLRGRITGFFRDREAVSLVLARGDNLDLTLQYIKAFYYKPVNEKDCVDQILAGGVSACTDRFSYLEDRKEAQKEEARLNGHFGGVGIVINYEGKKTKVESVSENFPAKKAGIRPGDEIIAISSTGAGGNLISVSGLRSLDEIGDLIGGDVGTKVLISVSRNGKIMSFAIERVEIINSSVTFSKPEDKIGYVKITEFIRPTADDFELAVSSLSQSGVKALVIDLRNNPGGLVNSVIGVISFFKNDEGPVIYLKKRNRPEEERFPDSENLGIFKNLKVVVLTNEWSASAAEIMSGWLKEDFGAIIVGKPTYGKDCGQGRFDFPDGSVLHLTTFHYLIGDKKVSVGNGGVKPTIEIENKNGEGDEQLKIALEQANKLLSK